MGDLMASRKYSRIYPSKRNPHCGYRYDYEHNVLEFVSKLDRYFNGDGERIEVLFMNWVVVSSAALAQEEWDVAPQYWVDFYSGDVKERDDLKHGNLWNLFRINKPNFGLKAVS